MAKIIRFHGLIPIPVEVDVETLSPKIEDIEGAITYKTKAFSLFFFKFEFKKNSRQYLFQHFLGQISLD